MSDPSLSGSLTQQNAFIQPSITRTELDVSSTKGHKILQLRDENNNEITVSVKDHTKTSGSNSPIAFLKAKIESFQWQKMFIPKNNGDFEEVLVHKHSLSKQLSSIKKNSTLETFTKSNAVFKETSKFVMAANKEISDPNKTAYISYKEAAKISSFIQKKLQSWEKAGVHQEATLKHKLHNGKIVERKITYDPEAKATFVTTRLLGSGGFKDVFLAISMNNSPIARATQHARSGDIDELRKEHEQLQKYKDCSHVIKSHTIGNSGVYTEYMNRGDLSSSTIQNQAKNNPTFRKELASQIMTGVSQVHAKGYVHNDIKDLNFLAQEADGKLTVKIADFGLEKPQGGRGNGGGTPGFMSPEKMQSYLYPQKCTYTDKEDIYASGVMLYQMKNGRSPQIYTAQQEIFSEINNLNLAADRLDEKIFDPNKKEGRFIRIFQGKSPRDFTIAELGNKLDLALKNNDINQKEFKEIRDNWESYQYALGRYENAMKSYYSELDNISNQVKENKSLSEFSKSEHTAKEKRAIFSEQFNVLKEQFKSCELLIPQEFNQKQLLDQIDQAQGLKSNQKISLKTQINAIKLSEDALAKAEMASLNALRHISGSINTTKEAKEYQANLSLESIMQNKLDKENAAYTEALQKWGLQNTVNRSATLEAQRSKLNDLFKNRLITSDMLTDLTSKLSSLSSATLKYEQAFDKCEESLSSFKKKALEIANNPSRIEDGLYLEMMHPEPDMRPSANTVLTRLKHL